MSLLRKNVKQNALLKSVKSFNKDYEISETKLGEGHFASVFLGTDRNSKDAVAIKKVERSKLDDGGLKKVFTEIEILKMIDHPNVVRMFDCYGDKKFLYLVMEFVDGGTLFGTIVDESLDYTEQTIQKIILVLVKALKYCLDKGIIHRDVKPQNILLTSAGDLKLADFNLSVKINPDDVNKNILEEACGTLNYVAPEVLKNKVYYNYKCDVWSLGVICYVLLSGGFLPFSVPKAARNRKKKLAEQIQRGNWDFDPPGAWDSVSDLAKQCLGGMLDINPETRLTYDDLLSHPWLATETAELPNESISHEKLDQEVRARRKALETQKVLEAIDKFKDFLKTEAVFGEGAGVENAMQTALLSGDGTFKILDSLNDKLNL